MLYPITPHSVAACTIWNCWRVERWFALCNLTISSLQEGIIDPNITNSNVRLFNENNLEAFIDPDDSKRKQIIGEN